MPNLAHTPETALVSTADAAALLRRAPATVNRWAEAGRLRTAAKAPGLRGARLFAREDVEALADELRTGVPA